MTMSLTVFTKFLYMICLFHFLQDIPVPCCQGHPMVETGMQFLSKFCRLSINLIGNWLHDKSRSAYAEAFSGGQSLWRRTRRKHMKLRDSRTVLGLRTRALRPTQVREVWGETPLTYSTVGRLLMTL